MNKKIIGIGITCMFLVTSFSVMASIAEKENSSEKITLNYSFKTPVIVDIDISGSIYDRITIEDAPVCGNSGEPSLPAKGAYILIPQGKTVGIITVDPGEKICLGSGFLVEPVAECVPLSKISTAPMPEPDVEIYSSCDMFPGKFFTDAGTYNFRGYEILVLRLHPVQYIPAPGELFYYPDLTVSVETIEDGDVNLLFRGLEKDELEVVKKVDNPSIVDTYECRSMKTLGVGALGESYDMVIITSESLKSGFEPLKQAHDVTGVSTVIKTLSDIGSSDPEVIRDYIRDVHNNWGIDYILLGGDHDVVPARCLYAKISSSEEYYITPSDNYYACLDGSYNYDGDEYWGEPNDGDHGGDVDLIAEVYVGRACVGNATEVNNFVNKTIAYMSTDPDEEYLKDALMIGAFLGFNMPWGMSYMNELINKCTRHGYTTIGISSLRYDITKLYDIIIPFPSRIIDPSEIIECINNNVHIINNVGHSSPNYDMKMYNSDVDNLTNDKYCFIYSQGCYAGSFDNQWPPGYPDTGDCIAEHFTVKTNHGAFAGIWNARYGFGAPTTDGPSQRYHREFWDAVFNESLSVISEANQDSKEDNIWRINGNNMRHIYYGLNLFGDPAVELLRPKGKGRDKNDFSNERSVFYRLMDQFPVLTRLLSVFVRLLNLQ